MRTRRSRQNYTKEFKSDAVKLVTEQGYSCTEVGRRLGINHSNVTRWVREHRNVQEEPTQAGIPRSELVAENRRLRKENRRLQMEREILKKAAAFFAKESN
jgi:transposase